jgi:hypothetical protein
MRDAGPDWRWAGVWGRTLVGSLLLAQPALAQSDGGALLRWSAPAGCPSEAAVQRELATRLGERSGLAVQATGTITQGPRGYRLRLETTADGQSGLRELEAVDCQQLADAAEIIVALMVDPASVAPQEAEQLGTDVATQADAGVASSEEPPAPIQAPTEPVPEEEPEREEPEPEPEREDEEAGDDAGAPAGPPLHVSFVVRAGAVLDAGSLPDPGLGPTLALGARVERVELTVGGVWLPEQDVQSERRSGRVAVLQLLTGRASLCYRALGVLGTRRELGFAACVAGELGRTWGRGIDIAQSDPAEATFAAAFASLQAEWPLSEALGLYGELSAGLPLLHTTFRVQEVGTVHEEGPLLGRLGIGLVLSP